MTGSHLSRAPGDQEATKSLRSFRLLVTAALADASEALEAWQSWLAEFELDTLEGDSYWILPLLSRNLARAGGTHAEQQRLAGVYKQMRLRNAIMQPRIQALIDNLRANGCDVLPGAATALALGGEEAVSLDPAELLVPVDALEAANSIIQSHGWRHLQALPPRQLLPFVPSIRYRHEMAGDLVLCWRPFGPDCALELDDSLWQRAGAKQHGAPGFRMANPVDRVLMAMQKGSLLQVNVMLNRWSAEVTGPRLRDRAAELGLSPPRADLTGQSGKGISTEFEDGFLPSLHGFNFTVPPDASASILRLTMRHWRRYQDCPATLRPAGFVTYVKGYYRYTWRTETFSQVARKALQRLGTRFTERNKQGL